MHEPTDPPTSSSFNPFTAPNGESGEGTNAMVSPLRVRLIFPLFGGLLGLLLVSVHAPFWRPDFALSDLGTMSGLAQFCRGALAGMGVGILIDALMQRKFAQLAPGHWFLLLMAASQVTTYVLQVVAATLLFKMDETELETWFLVHVATYFILVLLILIPILLTTTEPRSWNILLWGMLVFSVGGLVLFPFVLFNAQQASGLIASYFEFVSQLGSFVLAVAMFVLAVLELVTNRPTARRRDIYHWLGTIVPPGLILLSIMLQREFGFI